MQFKIEGRVFRGLFCSENDVDFEDFGMDDVGVPLDSRILILIFPKEERKKLWKPWNRALIVKIVEKFLPYNFLA